MEFLANADGNVQKIFAKQNDLATNGFDHEDSYIMFSALEDDVNPYFLVEGKNVLDNRFNSLPYTSDLNFNTYKDNTIEFSLSKSCSDVEATLIDLVAETETILQENEPVVINVTTGQNKQDIRCVFHKRMTE